ncbi:MAG: hypothetical protein V1918_07405, partial [Planctomycetota bacterium]
MADWNVERGARRCAATGRAFEAGETYYSALVEEGDSFSRFDYSPEAWGREEKDRFFSFWRTRLPAEGEEPRRRFVDTEVIHRFFTRLEEAESPAKLAFRYLLALLLIRKRVLRLEAIERDDAGERLRVYDRRQERTLRVRNPEAAPSDLAAAQEELGAIF